MPGVNTTGLASTSDYNLGRGKVYFATLDTNGKPLEYRDLGNAPEFNITFETETLDHQSSRSGLKVTDKEVVVSQKASLSLTLDEINFQNLALFASGSSVNDADINLAKVGVTGAVICTQAQYVQNRWYDLFDTATGKRAYKISATNALAVKDNGVAMVVGTDYDVDAVMGRVFIKKASVGAGGVTFDITADGTAPVIDEVKALTVTTLSGALKFISENPADGDKQVEYQFHKVSLKAEGDFGLISDEWTKMQLKGVAEKNTYADADSPTLTIRTYAQ